MQRKKERRKYALQRCLHLETSSPTDTSSKVDTAHLTDYFVTSRVDSTLPLLRHDSEPVPSAFRSDNLLP